MKIFFRCSGVRAKSQNLPALSFATLPPNHQPAGCIYTSDLKKCNTAHEVLVCVHIFGPGICVSGANNETGERAERPRNGKKAVISVKCV